MNSIVFLGTGGGRGIVFSQVRASGGMYFELDGTRFIVDPGPGSLVNMRKLKLKDPGGIIVSHYHVDHITDVQPLIDGIKEPFLIAEEHCIKGDGDNFPGIGKYHISKAAFLKAIKAGDSVVIPGTKTKVTATRAKHTSPVVGFVIEGSRRIGYVSDTVYFNGIEKPYEGCDILILNVLVPFGKIPDMNKHLGIEQAIKLVNSLRKKPRMIVLQHFSFWMLKNSVYRQAKILEKETGLKTIPASDFMKIDLDNMSEEKTGLEKFAK